ncbi:uncharacterized protein K452DRAFT_302151 [Aplosporella prunicola CBS 121167]|uniref:Uncharacterized protein n=1 Tax=Aplosporella prunicola CBS 121167 TaxID=1176127 RepID=A0A6A6B2J3_9PEZI|nr:uncharacterized protein K452DRAFT_302151 [Aplosporella prunicola CBS 121167]KAF2137237.1 hypothetical protein K452DRAFT_302151 [Aplosporella prunicola CBS 121167]
MAHPALSRPADNHTHSKRAIPEGESDGDVPRSGVINLYFLFIGVVVILLLIALYLLHRRKKKRKEILQATGQAHLARDLDGWANTRRWIHGNRAPLPELAHPPVEGLNEHGEAPPPYQPAPGPAPEVAESPVIMAGGTEMHQTPTTAATPDWTGNPAGLAIPMRTITRDTQVSKPPDYDEALEGHGHGGEASDLADATSSTANLARPSVVRHGS